MALPYDSISGEIKAAIRAVPADDWRNFFQHIKQNVFATIGQLSEKELTEMQAHVTMLNTIEGIFTSIKTNTSK